MRSKGAEIIPVGIGNSNRHKAESSIVEVKETATGVATPSFTVVN